MAIVYCKDVTFQDVQAVIFDKDGTLAQSETFLRNLAQRRSRLIDAQIPGVHEPLLMAFGINNNQIDPAGLMAVGTRQENEIAAAAYVAETGRGWVESLGIVRSAFVEADRYMEHKANHTPLVEGALELLLALTQAGLKVGLLSSDSTSNVEDFVQTYELEPYIHIWKGVGLYSTKSDPRLMQEIFAVLGSAPNKTLMIGDSQADIQIASDFGLAGCIGVKGGWTSSTMDLSQATVLVSALNEVRVAKQ